MHPIPILNGKWTMSTKSWKKSARMKFRNWWCTTNRLLPSGMREAGILCDNSGHAVGVNVSVAESLGLDGLREAMIELAVQPNA